MGAQDRPSRVSLGVQTCPGPLQKEKLCFWGRIRPRAGKNHELEDSRSRKGLGLGPSHTPRLHREDVQPSDSILAQHQLRQLGLFSALDLD